MKPNISEAEWEVMKAVWKRERATAQQIVAALQSTARWTPATVKTLINRLLRKGLLRYERTEGSGKSYTYFPAVTEKACRAAEADSFLRRVFDGALSPMLAHFVESKALRPEELAELEGLLKPRKKGK